MKTAFIACAIVCATLLATDKATAQGARRDWLPWVSVNHIHGIVGLDQLDKNLYRQLSKAN